MGKTNNTLSSVNPTRRLLFGLLVAVLSGVFVGGSLGFAAAGEGASLEVPSTFQLPAPMVGDRGQYNFSLVASYPGGDVVLQPERPGLRFSWQPATHVADATGRERHSNPVLVQRFYDWSVTSALERGIVYHMDSTSGGLLAIDLGDGKNFSWMAAPITNHDLLDSRYNYTVRAFVPVLPGGDVFRLDPFCGLRSVFQGREVDIRAPLPIFHTCTVRNETSERGEFRATRAGQTPYGAAIRFDSLGANRRTVAWFSPAMPYPLQVAAERTGEPNKFDVIRLATFDAGTQPVRQALQPPGDVLPPISLAPRQPWGPDDSDVNHPFRLSEAFKFARDDSENSDLGRFLAAHADAYTERAEYEERLDTRDARTTVEIRKWWFVVTDGHSRLPVGLVQERVGLWTSGIAGLPPVPDFVPLATHYRYENDAIIERGQHPFAPRLPQDVPRYFPTARTLLDRWSPFAGPEFRADKANSWGFDMSCPPDECWRGEVSFRAGFERSYVRAGSPGLLDADSEAVELLYRISQVHLDPGGNATMLYELHAATESNVVDAASNSAPSDLGVSSAGATPVLWRFPAGRYAVATGLLAVLAGLAYYLWPSVKQMAFAPFYSRIEKPTALDHPGRAELAALIDANPGIHFQEITRRLGWGIGVTRHHLAKLVHVGLVSEQAGTGYTCYFPKGKVDRRLMAATPVLKGHGARSVLAAVQARPGASLQELAAAAGLTSATANYHLKRLADAALVQVERAGRSLRVQLTELGQKALAQGVAA